MVSEGVITREDIDEAKSGKGKSRVLSIGLPAYAILQGLLRSARADSDGFVLSELKETDDSLHTIYLLTHRLHLIRSFV